MMNLIWFQEKGNGVANSPLSDGSRRSPDSNMTRPNYLNLNPSSSLNRLNQSSPSPASSRLVSRMTTLHEEKPAPSALASPVSIQHRTNIKVFNSSYPEIVKSDYKMNILIF